MSKANLQPLEDDSLEPRFLPQALLRSVFDLEESPRMRWKSGFIEEVGVDS